MLKIQDCPGDSGTVGAYEFDIFKFLFSRKGKVHERGMGMQVYEKEDFDTEFFSSGWDVTYDRLGNGCCIDYPIAMKPSLKYGPKCFSNSDDGTLTPKSRLFYMLHFSKSDVDS